MFMGVEDVQIDFPLVTARQCGFESKIRATAESEGLTVEDVRGSDGARFLDVYLVKDADAVLRACRAFLREVFGAGEDTRLEFDGDAWRRNRSDAWLKLSRRAGRKRV